MSRPLRILTVSGALLLAGLIGLNLFSKWLLSRPKPLPVLGEVGDFAVTNQSGLRLDRGSLLGRPWVADLIFTRCPGPCRQLTAALRKVQEKLPAESPVRLVSVTSDPEFDTPAILGRYAGKFGVDTNRWQFVTGTRESIRNLATTQLKLVLVEKPEADRQGPDDLFLHSTLAVVVDGKGRLRAAVELLETGGVETVLEALKALEREE